MKTEQLKKIVRAVGASSALVLFLGVGSSYASVNIGGANDTTGCNSENENTWDIADNFKLDIENNVDANNDLDYDVNSGRNDIGCNTVTEDISTGDVSGDIELINDLSMDDMNIDFADFGDIDVDLENFLTGPSSDNSNTVDIDNSVRLDVENNIDINNNLELDANTGRNHIRNNTCVGDISTGDVNFDVRVENTAGGLGGIVLPSIGGRDISADFSNDTTGPNSENHNELNIDSSVRADINNNVNFNNEINVDANTGHNTVSNNTVVGDVQTGSVDLNVRVINSSN